MNRQVIFLLWLMLLAIFVFVMTASPKRRRWRRTLLVIIAGTWIVSAGLAIPSILQQQPFFKAVSAGDSRRVVELISKNPKFIQSRTLMRKTALHLAVESGNTNMVAVLIRAGADVNAKGDSVTPLLLGAFDGNAQIVEQLLNAGAKVNGVGFRHNSTPLHVAALHGYENVVKLLLEHGANVNAEDMLHKTPLQLAQENGRTNVIAILTNPPSSKH